MNRLKSSMLVVLAAVMFASLALIPSSDAKAQSSAALSIPPRKDYTIEPGKGVNDTLQIRNLDREQNLNLSMRVVDFTYTDEGGTPKLLLDEDAEQTPWSLKSFIDIPETITIAPDSSESIDMSVNIPANQGAGSYYSAIIFSSSASEGGNVGLSASGVSLAFVNVPGDLTERLLLKELGAYDPEVKNSDGSEGKYIFFNMDMPQRIGYTLKNEGNVAEAPVGSITLRNVLFGKEAVINDMNPNKSLALIDQTRTFVACIRTLQEEVEFDGAREEASKCSEDAGLWPGLYRVEINGFYGWNGNSTQEIIGKTWMIYAPWWFLLIVFAVLAFVAYQGWKLKRYIDVKRGHTTGNKKYIARGRK